MEKATVHLFGLYMWDVVLKKLSSLLVCLPYPSVFVFGSSGHTAQISGLFKLVENSSFVVLC